MPIVRIIKEDILKEVDEVTAARWIRKGYACDVNAAKADPVKKTRKKRSPKKDDE